MSPRFFAVVLTLSLVRTVEGGPPVGKPLFIPLAPGVLPYAVGANGFVLVGSFFSGGALYWMPTSDAVSLGGIAAVGVSRDGRVIAGTAFDRQGNQQAGIWTGGRQWQLLGSVSPDAQPCDGLLSSAYGTSGDGSVVVGLAWNGCGVAHAFRWQASTGMTDLGASTPTSSRANNVSGDGKVVVGWVEDTTGFRDGAYWTSGTPTILQGPNGAVGEAYAASKDGSFIVGTICDPFSSNPTTWTWTAAGGVQCYTVAVPSTIPTLFYQALMESVSDDGRVIGGALSFGLEAQALVWFDGQVVFLKDYLRQNGLPTAFAGWVNTGFVTGVSPDGRVLVGYGAGPTAFQGYIVILPEPQ
jgi:probable HAF family extracellular repeat protein